MCAVSNGTVLLFPPSLIQASVKPHSSLSQTSVKPQSRLIQAASKSHSRLMQASVTPHSSRIQGSCKPQSSPSERVEFPPTQYSVRSVSIHPSRGTPGCDCKRCHVVIVNAIDISVCIEQFEDVGNTAGTCRVSKRRRLALVKGVNRRIACKQLCNDIGIILAMDWGSQA